MPVLFADGFWQVAYNRAAANEGRLLSPHQYAHDRVSAYLGLVHPDVAPSKLLKTGTKLSPLL